MPAGLQLVVVRSQPVLPLKCPEALHLWSLSQSNCGTTHSSHSPPLASQIVVQTSFVLQALPAGLHVCNVSGEVGEHRNMFGVQRLQAFVLVLQPVVPQETSSMKPV